MVSGDGAGMRERLARGGLEGRFAQPLPVVAGSALALWERGGDVTLVRRWTGPEAARQGRGVKWQHAVAHSVTAG